MDYRRAHLSTDICNSRINRQEAINILKTPAWQDLDLENELSFIATKLGYEVSELKHIMNKQGLWYKDYSNNEFWKEVGCPITYSVIKDPQKGGMFNYKLLRRGPIVNESGFYVANQISNSVIIDKLSSKPELDMICPENEGWKKKVVKVVNKTGLNL